MGWRAREATKSERGGEARREAWHKGEAIASASNLHIGWLSDDWSHSGRTETIKSNDFFSSHKLAFGKDDRRRAL